ncbi:MAG: hypothetical protein EOM37_04820 [Proteobacteria bacterium]|jgi:uncharacterized phiE125 gp8 family phage protein|nr:head-tail connector protein [Alphaproteobacteria bacterium]NCC03355.1 hypothetical protein [Pseudomonadota bacterium]
MLSHILVTPPASEPVTLTDFKTHARITSTQDDPLLTGLLKAARQWCEHYTRRAFIHQVWELALSTPPSKESVTLPRTPLAEVVSVQLYDEDDQLTNWISNNYYGDTLSQPGRLVLREGAVWPDFSRCANGMVITYRAGYGEDPDAVPEAIKLAIKQLALHWYEYRGEAINTTMIAPAPLTIEALLHDFRLYSMGAA